MNNDFKEVGIMKYWCQKVLPLVYDDSLSYYELLGKIVKKLNDLIENNDKLPSYIQQLIESYITSGAIGEVVREILTGFMLNVKNPPNNLKPAIGDGTQDDTEAIQGCIDYARAIGGGCVYVPNGVYLTQSLVLYDNVSLFGFDRYSARLVLKGGATKPMFTGNVTNTSLTGLTIDGNMDIQVNNINLIDINAEELILQNLVLTDGYVLVNATVNKSTQISDVICDYSVVQHMNLSGSGLVLGSNIYLHDISKLKGTNLVTLNNNNSVLSNIVSNGEAPVGFIINGNNNSVSGTFDNAVIPFEDNGTNNTIINNGKTEQIKITGNRTNNVGGNETNNINGKYEINSENIKLNPTQPLEYKEPILLNEYFKTIPFKHDNENYDVLVKGEKDIVFVVDDVYKDLEVEVETRKQADIEINKIINQEIIDRTELGTTLTDAISQEIEDRIESIDALDDKLTDMITDETTTRESDIRDINNKLIPLNALVVNVKNFGAKGDGVTDDTNSIQSAINSVKESGGIVVIPAGIYLFTTLNVTGCDYLSLQGAGVGTTILRQTNTTLDAIKCTADTWWQSFKDFTIDTNISKTSGSMFYFASGKRTTLERIDIKGWYHGINFASYENCWVSKCSITEPSGVGNGIIAGKIANTHMGANLYLTECFLRGDNLADIGIQVLDTDAVFATGNDIGAFNTGVKIEPSTISDNHYFVQNWFDATHKGSCVEIGGAGVKRDITFTGCWFASAGKSGVGVGTENALKITGQGAYGTMQLTGCRFFNSAGSGIYIDSPYSNVVFTGCVIRECGNANTPSNNYGIYIGTSSNDAFVKYTGGSIQSAGDNVFTTASSRGFSFDSVTMFGKITNNGTARSFAGCTSVSSNTIPSATSLIISPTKKVYYVTGTTNIISINKTYDGHMVTFKFNDILVVATQNNIHLNGDFTTKNGSTLTVVYDETLEAWIEVGRAE